MEFKVLREKGRNVVGFRISPPKGCSRKNLVEDGYYLNVLADAIQKQKGKCVIDLDGNILSIDFEYDRTGGSFKFYVNDSDNRYLINRILKHFPLIKVKKRYELPFYRSNPERNAMIIHLRIIYPALFKWLFET